MWRWDVSHHLSFQLVVAVDQLLMWLLRCPGKALQSHALLALMPYWFCFFVFVWLPLFTWTSPQPLDDLPGCARGASPTLV